MKIKSESEISSHITLLSVISGLFYTRYLHAQLVLGLVIYRCKVDVLAATLTLLSKLKGGKVAVKAWLVTSLAQLL